MGQSRWIKRPLFGFPQFGLKSSVPWFYTEMLNSDIEVAAYLRSMGDQADVGETIMRLRQERQPRTLVKGTSTASWTSFHASRPVDLLSI